MATRDHQALRALRNRLVGILPGCLARHMPYSEEIAWQMVLSSTAFMIEHPDKAKDGQSVALSGLLGAIKAYQAILKQDSASRWAQMDKLIQMREQGKLDDFVSETRRKCERDEEQEDPNTLHAQAY